MPLSTFDELPANTKDIIDLHLGYEDNDQGYLHWGTEMQLAYTEDELSGMAVLVDTTCRDGLYLQMSQKKCFRFAFDIHMDWEYTRYFGMKTRLNILSLSNQDAYLGRAKTTINLHMLSHPGKVTIDLGLDGGFGRKVSYLEETYDLGNIADLNIKLDWQISKSFKLSAWARNLLAHEYEIIPGAPAQKLNVHAGFDWRF